MLNYQRVVGCRHCSPSAEVSHGFSPHQCALRRADGQSHRDRHFADFSNAGRGRHDMAVSPNVAWNSPKSTEVSFAGRNDLERMDFPAMRGYYCIIHSNMIYTYIYIYIYPKYSWMVINASLGLWILIIFWKAMAWRFDDHAPHQISHVWSHIPTSHSHAKNHHKTYWLVICYIAVENHHF